jgi:alkyldihydroxyacetonephosphate synthase
VRAAELEALRRDLGRIVGLRHVTQADAQREPYARDLWPRAQLWARAGESRFPPDAVVWPRTTDEVSRVVRYARERHIPITPFGAGSSVVGGALAARAGITLDLKRMRDVLALDLGARRVTAQAGVMGQRLEDTLQAAGATLGHFPSSIHCSTLGGWIAARGAGQFSSHYGKIEDMLLGLTAVAGTGDVVKAGPERAPGVDLVQLLCGSEGTLAVVTDATLSIHPRPTARALRGFHAKNTAAGLEAMRRLFRAGLRPQLLRLYDPLDSLVAGAGAEGQAREEEEVPGPLSALVHGLKQRSVGVALAAPAMLNRAADLLPERALLVLSFEGEQLAACEEHLRSAMEVLRETGASDLGEGPARRWYARRHSTGYKQSGVFAGHGWVDTMEVAGTWDRVLSIFQGVRDAARGEAFVLCHFSHSYLEGCSLYFTLLGPAPTVERGEASYERTWKAALRAALDAGATLSHHHGVGLSKARHLPDELGDSGMRLLRSLKATFDPDGILNPGKLLG